MIKLRVRSTGTFIILLPVVLTLGCKSVINRQDVRPRVLRDVPAQNLAYRLNADVSPPSGSKIDDTIDKQLAVQSFFTSKREDDALLRTVTSPDGRRVLALYGTADEPSSAFRIDLFNSDGQFLRNLIPPDLSCVFPETVAWSPDGNSITFVAHRRVAPSPSPTPPIVEPDPEAPPAPAPSVAPVFAPVATFNTEQIYLCDRDGYNLRPLTSREGLIYFYFAWAPDAHALVALACKEDEWNAREKQYKLPAGRPRLIGLDGQERLLDDQLTEAQPVWSPDASKVATAFESVVTIYDAVTAKPTQARLPLTDALLAASVAYEQKTGNTTSSTPKGGTPGPSPRAEQTSNQSAVPASFNPIVRLEWPSPERLYFQTAFVRLMPNEAINTFQRWHLLSLSAQAAILK